MTRPDLRQLLPTLDYKAKNRVGRPLWKFMKVSEDSQGNPTHPQTTGIEYLERIFKFEINGQRPLLIPLGGIDGKNPGFKDWQKYSYSLEHLQHNYDQGGSIGFRPLSLSLVIVDLDKCQGLDLVSHPQVKPILGEFMSQNAFLGLIQSKRGYHLYYEWNYGDFTDSTVQNPVSINVLPRRGQSFAGDIRHQTGQIKLANLKAFWETIQRIDPENPKIFDIEFWSNPSVSVIADKSTVAAKVIQEYPQPFSWNTISKQVEDLIKDPNAEGARHSTLMEIGRNIRKFQYQGAFSIEELQILEFKHLNWCREHAIQPIFIKEPERYSKELSSMCEESWHFIDEAVAKRENLLLPEVIPAIIARYIDPFKNLRIPYFIRSQDDWTKFPVTFIKRVISENGVMPLLFRRRGLEGVWKVSWDNDLQDAMWIEVSNQALTAMIGRLFRFLQKGELKGEQVWREAKIEKSFTSEMFSEADLHVLISDEYEFLSYRPILTTKGNILNKTGAYSSHHAILRIDKSNRVNLPSNLSHKVASEALVRLKSYFNQIYFDTTDNRQNTYIIATLSALLMIGARTAFKGSVPAIMIEASQINSGKTFLADLIHRIALWQSQPIITPEEGTRGVEELRKQVDTRLYAGQQHLFIDNLPESMGRLSSSSIAGLITAGEGFFRMRILGKSMDFKAPRGLTIIVTANNPLFSTDLARRFIRIKLDTNLENPMYVKFETSAQSLHQSIESNRVQNLTDIYTIVQAFRESKPEVELQMSSGFETFDEIRKIMIWICGVDPGYYLSEEVLSNQPEREILEELYPNLVTHFQGQPFTTETLCSLIEKHNPRNLYGMEPSSNNLESKIAEQLRRLKASEDVRVMGSRMGRHWKGKTFGGLKLVIIGRKWQII